MSTVRDDLDGVVWYVDESGAPRTLKAGDEIPAGVELGDHLIADPAPSRAKSTRSAAKPKE